MLANWMKNTWKGRGRGGCDKERNRGLNCSLERAAAWGGGSGRTSLEVWVPALSRREVTARVAVRAVQCELPGGHSCCHCPAGQAVTAASSPGGPGLGSEEQAVPQDPGRPLGVGRTGGSGSRVTASTPAGTAPSPLLSQCIVRLSTYLIVNISYNLPISNPKHKGLHLLFLASSLWLHLPGSTALTFLFHLNVGTHMQSTQTHIKS